MDAKTYRIDYRSSGLGQEGVPKIPESLLSQLEMWNIRPKDQRCAVAAFYLDLTSEQASVLKKTEGVLDIYET